ncbi:MAG TPA: LuxR C-terminal-related transcriptional regulator [Streptosporangiaceae bacterium]|nr:LuxR C-terminal-related transcriptional regulator [Streptosporangiaceae bacterium]
MTTLGAAKNAEVTAREAEVLALIARHLTNAQIAEALFISRRTVETHVSALLRKLQLPDRRSLARHAEAMPGLLVKSGRRGLPLPVTSFIGRTGEQTVLVAALAEHRMVTATGPGGIGKTRLALSVAAELAPARREGVWFVDLIHVTDPAMVTAAVAETVGVPEQRTTSVDRALVASLAASDALLVIDNCEHVLDGVRPCVERIIAGCPEVTVLATSRTRLLLPYERVYVVPGLSVIGGGGDAVDLFAARVTAATGDPTPPDPVRVAALCRALDGMALAIELAAARFAALGLDGLESGLDQRLRLLTADPRVADRHASLRAAIGWSYNLLSFDDRALLRRVAVFASSFEVDAARAVAGAGREHAEIADGLARLAEHSLLVVERGERTRYRALETIRQYGVEQLDQAGELDQIRAGHERWCRRALAALGQTRTADIDDAWCARFDQIADDAGAALAWSAGQESRRAQAAELAAELAGLLFLRGRPAQAQRRYEQGAELAATATERAALLRLAAGAAASRFVGDDALRMFRMAADAALTAGDRAGAARDLATMAMYINRAPGIMATQHPPAEADALIAEARPLSDGSPLARAALAVGECPPPGVGDPRRAVELAERAGDGIVHSVALDWLTSANLADHDVADAVRTARRRLELLDTLTVGPLTGFEFADGYLMAAEVDLAAGHLPGAAAHADALAGLPFYRHEDHLAMSRRLLVDALAGHFDDVVRTGERFRASWERAGRPVAPNLARAPYVVAMVHGMRGDDERRAAWVRLTIDLSADPERLAGCQRGWPAVFDGMLALHRNDPVAAVRRLAADIDDPELSHSWDFATWRPWYAALWAEAAVLGHDPDAGVRVERSRHAARDNPIAAAIVERAAAITTGDREKLVRLALTFAQLGCPYQQARTGRIAAGPLVWHQSP